jgi:hypothetical protein
VTSGIEEDAMLNKLAKTERKNPGTFEDRFVRQLSLLAKGTGDTINNFDMMKALDWPK